MPIEETIWDVVVPNDVDAHQYQFQRTLAKLVAERLSAEKKLLAVVGWSTNGGGLFQPRAGVRRYAVSYRVSRA